MGWGEDPQLEQEAESLENGRGGLTDTRESTVLQISNMHAGEKGTNRGSPHSGSSPGSCSATFPCPPHQRASGCPELHLCGLSAEVQRGQLVPIVEGFISVDTWPLD